MGEAALGGLVLAAVLLLAAPRSLPGGPSGARARRVRWPARVRALLPLPAGEQALRDGAAVADAAGELATLLRAGVAAAPAWEHVARSPGTSAVVGSAVRAAATAARAGADAAAAVRRCSGGRSARCAAEPLAALAAAWEVAERTGAPPADVLDALAEALLADREHALARRSALAGPRSTAAVLAVLPVAGVGLGLLVGVDPVGVLLASPSGRVIGVSGLALAAGGWAWTRALVRSAERAG